MLDEDGKVIKLRANRQCCKVVIFQWQLSNSFLIYKSCKIMNTEYTDNRMTYLNDSIDARNVNLRSFDIKKTLCPKIWKGWKMRDSIR